MISKQVVTSSKSVESGRQAKDMDPPALSKISIGLQTSTRATIIAQLNVSLANAAVLSVKTKKVHWDVVGPQFRSLHQLLDENYTAIEEMIDALAERARMLGGHTIGTMADFTHHSELSESPQIYCHSTEAVHLLVTDHETVVRQVRKAINVCAELDDAGTADMLTAMLREHEKMLWMLRSFVEGESVIPAGDHLLPHASSAPSPRAD